MKHFFDERLQKVNQSGEFVFVPIQQIKKQTKSFGRSLTDDSERKDTNIVLCLDKLGYLNEITSATKKKLNACVTQNFFSHIDWLKSKMRTTHNESVNMKSI